jgi:hypothetical protein
MEYWSIGKPNPKLGDAPLYHHSNTPVFAAVQVGVEIRDGSI